MIVQLLILLLVAALIYASCSIRSQIYMKVFCRQKTKEKVVAITFDDGPHPVETPRVLQVLKEHQVPACFFCIGRNVKGNELLLQQMINEGHLVGNHTFTHTGTFPLFSRSRMEEDLQACRSALEKATSQEVKFFRPPFGVTNPTIAQVIKKLGYIPIGWNIRTFDTQQPSTEKVLQRIRKKLTPGSIILLHDRMPGSDLLLKEILKVIEENGYKVVRVDKMMS